MLLTTFLLALPFAPAVLANPVVNVSVSLDNPAQLPGGPVLATVNVSPMSNLDAYDLIVQWNPDVLTATSVTFAGTVLPSSPSLETRIIDLFQAGGNVHAFITPTFPTDTLVSPSSPSPLLFINFNVNNPPGSSTLELPTTVHIFSAELDQVPSAGVHTLLLPSTTDASYSPPPSWFTSAPIDFRTFVCSSTPATLNTNSHHGFTVPLQCSVANNSTSTTVLAGVHFSWTSLRGLTGSGGSGPVSLAPGQTAVLTMTTTSLISPGVTDIYTISAIVGYGFADGTATRSAGPFTFQLQVNVPQSPK